MRLSQKGLKEAHRLPGAEFFSRVSPQIVQLANRGAAEAAFLRIYFLLWTPIYHFTL